MASTYTTNLRLTKQGDGENPNSWGQILNDGVISLADSAVAGYTQVSVGSTTSVALTQNNGSSDQSRSAFLEFTGSIGSAHTSIFVLIPNNSKGYVVRNSVSYNANSNVLMIRVAGNTGVTIRSTDVNAFGAIAFGYGTSSNAEKRTGRILYSHADKEMVFYNNESEVMRFKDSDDVEVANGNVVIKTSGKGINFSATADAGGMSNELLDDYEEGTWTPALTYGGAAVGLNTPVGTYVKVGNLICCRCRCHTTDNPSGNNVNISGLPYTSSNPANDGNAITGAVYMETCASGITTGHPMAFGFDNSTNFDIRMSGTTGGGTSQVSDAAGTGTSYMTTITYQTS